MHRAVDLFCAHLCDGAYCVVYLAGHGFENDAQCYIVPTDAPNKYSSVDCFSVKRMIKQIRGSCHLNLTVILLDVCRKRNENTVNLNGQSDIKRNSGNFVLSYATMESGMAYEVKGQHLGVYVSSLQRHLSKDKRVTRVLELVHKDLHKDMHTKGMQQPEFKSNMFEDRKLTDPVAVHEVDPRRKIEDWDWRNTHSHMKPVGFFFESCGALIRVDLKHEYSNVLLLSASVFDPGLTEDCSVTLELRQNQDRTSDRGEALNDHFASSSVKIANLQRLIVEMKDLPVVIHLRYCLDCCLYEEEHEDLIRIPFVTWWHS